MKGSQAELGGNQKGLTSFASRVRKWLENVKALAMSRSWPARLKMQMKRIWFALVREIFRRSIRC